jgi:type III restriction enzyme
VNFKTTRPCVPTIRSHINQVVADTDSWEQAAVFRLEEARDTVAFYARNDHLELSIPYEYLGIAYSYFPDFVVRLTNGTTLLLEIKGEEREKDRAKHQAARRWVSAVNHWGQLGRWSFLVCRDPQQLGTKLKEALDGHDNEREQLVNAIRTDAERELQLLRERGWTQADFARALRELLEQAPGRQEPT